MSRNLKVRLAFACAAIVVGFGVSGPVAVQADSFINVKNSLENPFTLSDLYVYGDNPGERLTIKKLGDATDDVVMPGGTDLTFTAEFKITSYFVSTTTVLGEHKSRLFKIYLEEPDKVSFLRDPSGAQDLSLAVDASLALPNPPLAGTTLNFLNGTSAGLPGWFVGTSVDEQTGDVSGPYTGPALVDSNPFEVTVTPEPATLSLLALGGLALLRRRRKA